LDRRVGGPQSWSGCSGEEKNSKPLPGLKTPIIQSAAQQCTTALSWSYILDILMPNPLRATFPQNCKVTTWQQVNLFMID